MKIEPIKHYRIPENAKPEMVEDTPFGDLIEKIQARVVERVAERTDDEIYRACIEAAREEGVTDLYLVDKEFVADAIREKLERMKAD